MAIVYEARDERGTVRIVDDAYRDCTREEMERRRAETRRVAGEILLRLTLEGKI
ncbi:MAG: hypothetical protein IJW30_00535 [Clostridia bacterium]|nr:hypothetical protein [Clostridia bacterium]